MVNHLVIGTEMDQVLKMEISMNTIGVESLISHLNWRLIAYLTITTTRLLRQLAILSILLQWIVMKTILLKDQVNYQVIMYLVVGIRIKLVQLSLILVKKQCQMQTYRFMQSGQLQISNSHTIWIIQKVVIHQKLKMSQQVQLPIQYCLQYQK